MSHQSYLDPWFGLQTCKEFLMYPTQLLTITTHVCPISIKALQQAAQAGGREPLEEVRALSLSPLRRKIGRAHV